MLPLRCPLHTICKKFQTLPIFFSFSWGGFLPSSLQEMGGLPTQRNVRRSKKNVGKRYPNDVYGIGTHVERNTSGEGFSTRDQQDVGNNSLDVPYADACHGVDNYFSRCSLSDVGHASGKWSPTYRVHLIPDVMLRRKFLFICNFFKKICNFYFVAQTSSLFLWWHSFWIKLKQI